VELVRKIREIDLISKSEEKKKEKKVAWRESESSLMEGRNIYLHICENFSLKIKREARTFLINNSLGTVGLSIYFSAHVNINICFQK
jgi:hypothetical protein